MTNKSQGGFTRPYNYGASDFPTSIQTAIAV